MEQFLLAGDIVQGFQELGNVSRAMVVRGMKESMKLTFGEDSLSLFGEDEEGGSVNPKGTELSIIGKGYRNWAIGGLYFHITAKKNIVLTGIEVHTREAGNYNIEVFSREGKCKYDMGTKGSWKVVTPKKSFQFFGSVKSTRVVESKIVLKKGQSISFVLSNNGNTSDGELCMDGQIINTFPNDVKDDLNNDDLSVSQVFFTDRTKDSFQLYSNIHAGSLVGKVLYKK
eukprot:TRINITY_DN535_c0_g1_i1.p1 TRINITY_DN535_c0_g1~~TRINITY_DN535_c0_g1_i1.p1  ORF type:complete len:228 (-),score=71.31 TRINITY_DN535_c0_g1_i1:50-733(-)